MGDDKRLLYRLRNDGTSWAQGLFDEAADQIEDLECRLANARADASDCCDGYEGQISMLQEALKNTQSEHADAVGRVAALTAALTTRRSACDEESERADRAERQLAETRAALDHVMRESAAIARKSGSGGAYGPDATIILKSGAYGPA